MRPDHLKGQKLSVIEIADIMGLLWDIALEDCPTNGIRLNIAQERMKLSPEENALLEFPDEGLEPSEWSREEKVAFIKSRIAEHLQ